MKKSLKELRFRKIKGDPLTYNSSFLERRSEIIWRSQDEHKDVVKFAILAIFAAFLAIFGLGKKPQPDPNTKKCESFSFILRNDV